MSVTSTRRRNAVCNAVTNAAVNGPRCWVQNQNQIQTVVTAVFGLSVVNHQSQVTVTYGDWNWR